MKIGKVANKTISAAIATTAALSSLSANAAGLVTSQGDAAMNADIARTRFGIDGSGVIVGVMSDSFDNLGEAAQDIASGDLPSNINVLQELPNGGSDEGRALMQIIHDVAPGADLAFHTAFPTEGEYANGILELANAGADIIVSDFVYPTEPMFQDGLVAQAINSVVSQGTSYFTSAGNKARQAYESAFNPSDIESPYGGEFHDFDLESGVDTLQSLTIPSGGGIGLSFQWDSPFSSISNGTGSPNDLDIFLYDSFGTNLVASSTQSNFGKDPVEFLSFINEGSTSQFNLAIAKKSGLDPELMKFIISAEGARGFKINEYATASGTIFGNANAIGSQAVGAAFYPETPPFGTDPAQLQYFSSAGSTPILFDEAGNRLSSPEVRLKPEIVAPDGGNTTFFGTDIPEDEDNFPNLLGTSAAAPHAAAVAALMLDANPSLSPQGIYSILHQTALDMDDPSTSEFDEGFDFASGYGFINAERALNQVMQSVPEPSPASVLIWGSITSFFALKRKLKKTSVKSLIRKN